MSPIARKLTTILQMDAVSYSAAMEADEEKTFKTLLLCRRVIDRLIEEYQGRVFSTAGDAVLVEFGSPTQAVRFAIECQDALGKLDERSEGEYFAFRIGINLGDVIISGEDLLGDEVNIAARIEGLAEPGGICISSKVYGEVRGKIEGVEFISLGIPVLKNITRQIEVFALLKRGEIQHVPTNSILSFWSDNESAREKTALVKNASSIGVYDDSARRGRVIKKRPTGFLPLHSKRALQVESRQDSLSDRGEFIPPRQSPGKRFVSAQVDSGKGVGMSEGRGDFLRDCLGRLDAGDDGAIRDLIRVLDAKTSNVLAKSIDKKISALIAASSNADVLIRIGCICSQSRGGVIADKAVFSFRKAAAIGSTTALEYLGKSLIDKPASKFDVEEGVRCLESAASLRSAGAAMKLGHLHENGLMHEKDLVRAFLWYWAAAHLGATAARAELKKISILMTQEQRRFAASKADDFYRDLMLKKYYKPI